MKSGNSPHSFSLRVRLLLATLVFILIGLISTSLVLIDLFEDHVGKQLEQQLKIHLTQLTANVEFSDKSGALLRQDLSDPRFKQAYSGLYWQVSDREGRPILLSRSLWDTSLQTNPIEAHNANALSFAIIEGPEHTQLLQVERSIFPEGQPERLLHLQVAIDKQPMLNSLKDFTKLLVFSMSILTLGLIVISWLQIKISLSPLTQIRHRLTAIQEGETRSLEGNYPQEIQPLVKEFNTVLEHDNEVLLRARTQAGNLAHSLKTPLSIMAHAAHEEDTEFSRLVEEQVLLAERQINYHLARTRAAAAVKIPRISTKIQPSISNLVRVMNKLYHDKHLIINIEQSSEDMYFRGEEQDFHEMLGNILDNACKWARTHVNIRVFKTQLKQVKISIDDDGPGIDEEIYQRIFQRGERADENTPGSGIGLAIVKDLAQLYGGDITLTRSALGGLSVTLSLPTS